MIRHFLTLEWKAFLRSATFAQNLALKIITIFGALYFMACFLIMGVGAFYILKEMHLEPLQTVNKFMIYYLVFDLVVRLMVQKIPVLNIRPLLILPIKDAAIVHYSLGKTALSFFNTLHAFFFLPFSIVLVIEGYDIIGVIAWHISMMALIYCNNFSNIILNNKDYLLTIFIAVFIVLGGCQYYNIFNITDYTFGFFDGLYSNAFLFLIPVLALFGIYYYTFIYFKSNLYLDAGLSNHVDIAKTEQYSWLNQYGKIGTFLKNDIRLLRRNKRSKTTITMSILFLFYGLIFFTNNSQPEVMRIFAGVFVSGGFLITFGQFVPSWDSAYYPLMMTQNIPYKEYISSKWWLMVIATFISTILASFYLYFGWQIYLTIVVAAIYNMGVNSHLVLLGGAYTKTPIDLSTGKGAFGDKKAFNIKTLLISLPQMLVPIGLYALGSYLNSSNLGLLLVATTGIIGFAFRNKVFTQIEKVYKIEKYATLESYKSKNN